jgi:hypothetical protein
MFPSSAVDPHVALAKSMPGYLGPLERADGFEPVGTARLSDDAGFDREEEAAIAHAGRARLFAA